MAFGTLKCDTIENDNSQSITVASLVSLDTNKANLSGATFTGDITLNAQQEVRFADSDSSNYIAFASPATVSTNSTWTLPSDAPAANDVLSVSSVSSNNPTLAWTAPASGVLKKIHYHENSTRVASVSTSTGDKMTFITNFQPLDPSSNDLIIFVAQPVKSAGNNYNGSGLRFEGNGSSTTDYVRYGEGHMYVGATSYQAFIAYQMRIPAGTLSGTGSDTFQVHHRIETTGGSNIGTYNPNSSDESRLGTQTKCTFVAYEYSNS